MLSKREEEVLLLVCDELSSSQIATKLKLSIGTVYTHRRNILQKVGVKNTVGLVKFAMRKGILR